MRYNNDPIHAEPADNSQGLNHELSSRLSQDLAILKCSIRDLEKIATHLRLTGKKIAAESIDRRVMSMLEHKICKKMLSKQNRLAQSA